MNRLIILLSMLIFFSCQNEKILQLPEINHSDITDILDISHAYLFYDETKPDSIELNRKNLIISTNWLINVDKRLTLDQAIPSIVFLQNKKREAQMHKNEAAKNYFTCHSKNINNLGFIDFTDVYYHLEEFQEYLKNQNIKNLEVLFFNSDNDSFIKISETLEKLQSEDTINSKVFLNFDKKLTFQQYITYKEELAKLNTTQINIDSNEFIY